MAEILRLVVSPPPSLRRLMFPRIASTAAEQVVAPAAGAASAAFAVATSGRIVGGGAILSALGYMIAAGAVLVRVSPTLRMWRTKEPSGALNPLSTEVEMFFYAAQVLNGLRLKSPLHAWVDDLAHLVLGTATTMMLQGERFLFTQIIQVPSMGHLSSTNSSAIGVSRIKMVKQIPLSHP